ncbi:hypothetical protein, partial [Streptomyces griseolus]|uniref:hypothetical protein n=1 Tax=Streptomyces griseolus TaxID=1909 RepID=UPI0022443D92
MPRSVRGAHDIGGRGLFGLGADAPGSRGQAEVRVRAGREDVPDASRRVPEDDFFAAVFFFAEDSLAADFPAEAFPADDFLAADFVDDDFLAGDFLAGDFFA